MCTVFLLAYHKNSEKLAVSTSVVIKHFHENLLCDSRVVCNSKTLAKEAGLDASDESGRIDRISVTSVSSADVSRMPENLEFAEDPVYREVSTKKRQVYATLT